MSLGKVQDLVRDEITKAVSLHGEHYASDHEAFAVLLEEVDEVKVWVWKKRRERDRDAMVKELVQVAATAQKWAASLLEGPRGPREVGIRQAAEFIRLQGRHSSGLDELADAVEELAKA